MKHRAAPMSSDDVLCLDAGDLWSKPIFQDMLVRSLEKEGFDKPTIVNVKLVLDQAAPANFDAFQSAAEAHERTLPSSQAAGLADVIDHWSSLRESNLEVYRPSSAAEYKARFWPNNAKIRQANWELYEDIYEADLFVESNRFIKKETAITSAGSCFAANISRQLQHWGYNYLVEMKQPGVEHSTDPAACGNIYNAASMRLMVERAFGKIIPPKLLVLSNKAFLDPFRSFTDYDSLDGYHQKWTEHNAALARALRKTEVFILTLGMTEAWYLADSGLVSSIAPRGGCDPTLFRLKNLSVEENLQELEQLYAVFKKHNPGVKFITTVSPVPLNATFNMDTHVVAANGLSKATLRVALDMFSANHPEDVFYFPSYEVVVTATRDPWEIDMRHVSNAAVSRVMQQFQRMFMVDQSQLDILPHKAIAEKISQKRGYVRRYSREYLIHPLKKKLGIEGRPFSALLHRSNTGNRAAP